MIDAVCTNIFPSAAIFQLAKKYSVSDDALWNNKFNLKKIFTFMGVALFEYGC